MIIYIAANVTEMAIVMLIVTICFMICTILGGFKDKILACQNLLVGVVCFYVVASTYFLGYEKYSVIILIPLLFAICTFSICKKIVIKIWSAIILLSYIIVLYSRYNIVSKYNDSLHYIEIINLLIASLAMIFIIFAKFLCENFIVVYRNSYVKDLKQQIKTDFLTGLGNRRYMEELLTSGIDFTDAYIIIADIDYFKNVNDTYGHIMGDNILRDVSKLMVEHFKGDDRIARWGGEEFLIYIQGIAIFDAKRKLENFREEISKKIFEYDNVKINITLTFGVRNIDANTDITSIITDADAALYYGKKHGRNQVVFYESNM